MSGESWTITLTHTPGDEYPWVAEVDVPGRGKTRYMSKANTGPMAALHPLAWDIFDDVNQQRKV